MKLAPREMVLAWITLVAVIGGATYWFAEPKYKAWQERKAEMELLQDRMLVTRHLLEQRGEWEQELSALRDALPKHPADKEVTGEIMRNIAETASRNNLTLLRREPDKEEDLGDLFETSVHCTWDGELDALAHFLYEVQQQGAVMDIQSLSVAPMKGAPGRLKGSFTIDCAYTRDSDPNADSKESNK
ncbi:MAG: hypothetical protein EOM20_16155 [Spartobacteria bacterium]|nr:hypothetical protein [Spartobacteria bacterium]